MRTKVIKVQGMHSEEDANRVQQALNEVWGVRKVLVSLPKSEAVVSYDENAAVTIDFQQAIIDTGYVTE